MDGVHSVPLLCIVCVSVMREWVYVGMGTADGGHARPLSAGSKFVLSSIAFVGRKHLVGSSILCCCGTLSATVRFFAKDASMCLLLYSSSSPMVMLQEKDGHACVFLRSLPL